MENLNKKNFWDDLKKKSPKAFAAFSKFIDDYKEEVGWDSLFNAGKRPVGESEELTAPKFHDLPIEMQIGIIIRFFSAGMNGMSEGEKFGYIVGVVKDNFLKLEQKIKTQK